MTYEWELQIEFKDEVITLLEEYRIDSYTAEDIDDERFSLSIGINYTLASKLMQEFEDNGWV